MASTKTTALTSDASPTGDDLVMTVTDPAGTPVNRKATLADIASLFAGLSALTGAYAPISEPIAAAHIVDTSAAHAASAVSISDAAGDFDATNVESALAELQTFDETLSGTYVALAGTQTVTGEKTFDVTRHSTPTQGAVTLFGVDGLNGPAVEILAPAGKATGLIIVPAADVPQGGAATSQLIMYGKTGVDYDRFAISNVIGAIIIDSTYAGVGVARDIIFQMGGSVGNGISSQTSVWLKADASNELNGATYSAFAKTWGATRTTIGDQPNSGDSRLRIGTRTGSFSDVAADTASIELLRGGSRKWLFGLNSAGGNVDRFDFFSTALALSINQDGTLLLNGDAPLKRTAANTIQLGDATVGVLLLAADLQLSRVAADTLQVGAASGNPEVRLRGASGGTPKLSLWQAAERAYFAIDSGSNAIIDADGDTIALRPNNTEGLRVRDTIADTETALYIRRNVGGALSLQRVTMGAVDSGGAGFKVLRVAN